MKKKRRYAASGRGRGSGVPVLGVIAVGLALLVGGMAWFAWRGEDRAAPPVEQTQPLASTAAATGQPLPSTAAAPEDTVPPTEATEPGILAELEQAYQENPDLAGWIQIDGTQIDYPVMYTPDDPEKYLHLDFDGNYSLGGLPFLDGACSLDPRSDNLLLYGHNMQNGSMFHTLFRYEQRNFWEAHPNITFSTLSQEQEYAVLAAFYDRVYYTYEDCFKFYQFIDAQDQAAFDEAVTYFKEHALYDTGVTAAYGDELITLVTCAYHVDNGRFVVVAKKLP